MIALRVTAAKLVYISSHQTTCCRSPPPTVSEPENIAIERFKDPVVVVVVVVVVFTL